MEMVQSEAVDVGKPKPEARMFDSFHHRNVSNAF